MTKTKSLYHGHRFPASIISHAVRWYFRLQLSLRDIEELLFERGVTVSYETIRRWCEKFGAGFAHRVKAARRKSGSTWHLDEMFVTLRGEPYLLWRAVDEHGVELDILLQKRRDKSAAKRFFKRVLRSNPVPCKIVTDHVRDGTDACLCLAMLGEAVYLPGGNTHAPFCPVDIIERQVPDLAGSQSHSRQD
jgi:putative transposase